MDKTMGILLMTVFGISGAGAATLAWLVPSLHLDKPTATLAGIIGVGFAVGQGFRFKYGGHTTNKQVAVKAKAAENP
jgi:hypothetical protein